MSPTNPSALCDRIVSELRAQANADNVAGMARFGISTAGTLGVPMPQVKRLARKAKAELGRDGEARHQLAGLLWASGVHEARICASLVDDPRLADGTQLERWVAGFESWDVCDTVCINLFRRTAVAWDKSAEWCGRDEEFVKRAGFVLGATLAVHDKKADDDRFLPMLDLALRECTDERNFVKKAVNWQVRQIGKRSAGLNRAAVEACERMLAEHADSVPARWIARDALRELRKESVRARLGIAADE